jgi:hypothetical protein
MPRGSGIVTDERGYNGWPSYETWLLNLWLGNDPATDAICRELVAEAGSLREAAETLKALVEEDSPFQEQSGLYVDLLGAAFARVDWRALAEHYRRG